MKSSAEIRAYIRERIQIDDATGCWNWTGNLSPGGYGMAHINRRTSHAHRHSYIAHVGPIAPGLHVDHLCRNRRCVNPDHLEAVTPAENNRRGESPTAQNARKTHCAQGHELSEENISYRRDRPLHRECRACKAAWDREYVQRKAALFVRTEKPLKLEAERQAAREGLAVSEWVRRLIVERLSKDRAARTPEEKDRNE